jgi:hypothetical protein
MNKKYAPYLFAAVMSVMMGLVMSFAITIINTGIDDGFIHRWLKALIIGICVAFPTAIVIAPIAQKIVGRLIENDGSN